LARSSRQGSCHGGRYPRGLVCLLGRNLASPLRWHVACGSLARTSGTGPATHGPERTAAMSSDRAPEHQLDDLSRRDFLQQAAGTLAVVGGAAGPSDARAADVEPPQPDEPSAVPVTLQVNGRKHDLKLEPRVTLLDALRERLGLTGTKKG